MRKTHVATLALCCLLALALVLACTVYAAHTIEAEKEAHCDCPICRLFSVVGAIWVLSVALIAVLATSKKKDFVSKRETFAETPVLLFVKLNC